MGRRVLLAALVLVAVAAAGTAAAGLRAGAGSAQAEVGTTIYLLTDGGAAPLGVRRSIPRGSPRAGEALAALLAGPTDDERARGLTTALPAGTSVRAFGVDATGEAVVDLAGLSRDAGGVDRVRVITQVARSLVGLSGVDRVRLRADGEPWGLWLMSGADLRPRVRLRGSCSGSRTSAPRGRARRPSPATASPRSRSAVRPAAPRPPRAEKHSPPTGGARAPSETVREKGARVCAGSVPDV